MDMSANQTRFHVWSSNKHSEFVIAKSQTEAIEILKNYTMNFTTTFYAQPATNQARRIYQNDITFHNANLRRLSK